MHLVTFIALIKTWNLYKSPFWIAVTADKRSLPATIDITIDDYINNVQLVSSS